MRVGVAGLGYLGLTHAVAMAHLGHQVIGYDVNNEKVQATNSGRPLFFEPGLAESLAVAVATGKLIAKVRPETDDELDLLFLCVGTPATSNSGAADLSQLWSAVDALAPLLRPNTVIVGKSTVPPGTSQQLLEKLAKKCDFPVHLAWNPEFLREGSALRDSLEPDRIIIGASDQLALSKLKECLTKQISDGVPVVEMDLNTAELVKLASNAFLATKVSFINAMSEIAETIGGDALLLAKALGMDPRIGSKFLHPGLGFGGGCLPKDIAGFQAFAKSIGREESLSFLSAVGQINSRRRDRLVDLVASEFESLERRKVLLLGVSFKPNTDDMRDSPALEVALRLQSLGADITIHDPVSLEPLSLMHPSLRCEQDLSAALNGQELIVIGTDWDDYRILDPEQVATLVENKVIIDGRNILNIDEWADKGWRVLALGRNG